MRTIRLFVILGFLVITQVANAQVGGTFVRVGDMTMERSSPLATLLADGRVLILGGPPDLYDPSTRSFARSNVAPCSALAATQLLDEQVLIICPSGIASELYDPATDTLRATGAMIESQDVHSATLLPNGKVLIACGARAELYDPATGIFSLTGKYVQDSPPFVSPRANLTGDGRVLLTGVGLPEIYDPATGTWTLTAEAGSPAYRRLMSIVEWQAATSLMDGTVLISGGNDDETCGGFDSAEVFEPSTATFSFAGSMSSNRDAHSATLLDDGTVLVAGGGVGWCYAPTKGSAEIYDPAKRSFVPVGKMTVPRSGHSATLLKDGTVLIAGGFSWYPYTTLRSAELYVPVAPAHAGRRPGRR